MQEVIALQRAVEDVVREVHDVRRRVDRPKVSHQERVRARDVDLVIQRPKDGRFHVDDVLLAVRRVLANANAVGRRQGPHLLELRQDQQRGNAD